MNTQPKALRLDQVLQAIAPKQIAEAMNTQPEAPTAQLDWSLYVRCPKCEWLNDLADAEHDTEHDIARHIFTNEWDKLEGWEVTCEGCGHEFKIKKVEY